MAFAPQSIAKAHRDWSLSLILCEGVSSTLLSRSARELPNSFEINHYGSLQAEDRGAARLLWIVFSLRSLEKRSPLTDVQNTGYNASDMPDESADLNQRIAERISELRAASRFSLEALAERSGVSRSMISLLERGESNPTAALLEKLTRALGVPLASLFDAPTPPIQAAPEPVLR